jgi:hypothetical protein
MSRACAKALGAAVFIGRHTIDVFEREVGPPALVDAGVIEARDVRVLE